MAEQADPYVLLSARRLLIQGDRCWAPAEFDAAVLQRYRQSSAYAIIRTDTVGRLPREGGWTVDFGVCPGDTAIHVSLGDLPSSLPEEERAHRALHVHRPRVSRRYLQARLHPGSCIDDGEVRRWE